MFDSWISLVIFLVSVILYSFYIFNDSLFFSSLYIFFRRYVFKLVVMIKFCVNLFIEIEEY